MKHLCNIVSCYTCSLFMTLILCYVIKQIDSANAKKSSLISWHWIIFCAFLNIFIRCLFHAVNFKSYIKYNNHLSQFLYSSLRGFCCAVVMTIMKGAVSILTIIANFGIVQFFTSQYWMIYKINTICKSQIKKVHNLILFKFKMIIFMF